MLVLGGKFMRELEQYLNERIGKTISNKDLLEPFGTYPKGRKPYLSAKYASRMVYLCKLGYLERIERGIYKVLKAI